MSLPIVYRLKDVVRRYGESFSLRVLQLDVFSGETICLVGPTGAGKSTLLRLLTGLEPTDEGRVFFLEHWLNGALPIRIRRQMAVVHQRPLLPHGSVRWNVEYGLRVRNALDRGKVAAILDRLELRSLAGNMASTLSGGQMQLVALARALIVEPDVLLLDEPTANLDPARVALVEETIAQYRQRKPLTLVWATHNLFQARRVAQRVGLLLNGQLVDLSPTEEFFNRPKDSTTAAFVRGEMIY